ncbi:hypothetical protein [Candidatus Uabimicrobium amorphum]|uniref:DUF4412 domain-containing protein n=1 Tax=Uabimicrobium amorphum TaxID=2596890 RepID=A0A5S9IM30_UABAM|nr:hypothetical protein [Candidatus Uabimicrobium amorphum]BBM83936.1 hypothetical protein UABAM_02291 [Candidatus Uabimicrobium amorphum]
MKFSLILVMLLSLCCMFVAAEEEPVFVDSVTVEHVKGHTYKITVSGNAPNPGYTNVRLVPHTYMVAPESWEIVVLADPPKGGGMMIQVLKPYTVSLEHTFSDVTKSVTIIGRARRVEKKLGAKKATPPKKRVKEAIYGVKVKDGNVIFSVLSGGCTKKEHFECQVGDGKVPAITLYRTTPDYCEMVPHVVEISFSKKELGLKAFNFVIKNEFTFVK